MKILLFLMLFIISVFSQQQQMQQQTRQPPHPSTLPSMMANIVLPHTFTQEEMERIIVRLRALSLELQTFGIASQSMSSDQLQQNYQYAIWPIMQCLIANP